MGKNTNKFNGGLKFGKIAVADFETGTQAWEMSGNPSRVWAFSIALVDSPTSPTIVATGTSIQEFFRFVSKPEFDGYTIFFHNLKYDDSYIMNYLLKHYEWVMASDNMLGLGEWTTLISRTGEHYTLAVRFTNGVAIRFADSTKTFPGCSVADLAEAYRMDLAKGTGGDFNDFDYNAYRPEGHALTEKERIYVENDVKIVAIAIYHNAEQNLLKLTAASNAYNDWKNNHIGDKRFKCWFDPYKKQHKPCLSVEEDEFCRSAYRGGFVYCNPAWVDRETGPCHFADCNSMYPAQMLKKSLPVGAPQHYEGNFNELSEDMRRAYPLYIQRLTVLFELREGKLPMVQLHGTSRFGLHEYVSNSEQYVQITLTSTDLELFLDSYDVDIASWDEGLAFKGRNGNDIFGDYIAFWGKIKEESTGPMRMIAKRMLNSLYGKFATTTDGTQKKPIFRDGLLAYEVYETDPRPTIYTPMACFITAEGRQDLFHVIYANWDRFIYCDTDSVHLVGTEPALGCEYHDTRFGAWSNDYKNVNPLNTRHLRCKTYYVLLPDGKRDIKAAGVPKPIRYGIPFEEFHPGWKNTNPDGTFKTYVDPNGQTVSMGKLLPKMCQNGYVLWETPIEIKI